MENKRAIHAYLDNTAHQAWGDTADQHGVSVSAIIQAIGEQYANGHDPDTDLINAARRIDTARRRRGART